MPSPIEIPCSNIRVDDFKSKVPLFKSKTYLLTHFHADHYLNLGESWEGADILCSPQTAKLVTRILGVSERFVKIVPMRKIVNISKDVKLYFLDANHCPGAIVAVVFVKDRVFVHTGDMRASREMIENDSVLTSLGEKKGQPEVIYLDTTYANPKHDLPDRHECVKWIGDLFEREVLERNKGSRVLFVVVTYLMGKERILEEIEERMSEIKNGTFLVSERKCRVLRLLDNLSERFKSRLRIVDDDYVIKEDSKIVRVLSWGKAGQFVPGGWRFDADYGFLSCLQKKMCAEKTIVIVPTGWTYSSKSNSKLGIQSQCSESGKIEIHLVPYSEHSSYPELRDFVRKLKPVCVVPTVVSFSRTDSTKQRESKIRAVTNRFSDLIDRASLKRKRIMEMFGGTSTTTTTTSKKKKKSVSSIKQKNKKEKSVIVIDDDDDDKKVIEDKIEKWNCVRCTFLNDRGTKCAICEWPRSSSLIKKKISAKKKSLSVIAPDNKHPLTVPIETFKLSNSTPTSSFGYLCQCLELVSGTTKRLVKLQALTNYFQSLLLSQNKYDVIPAFMLLTNTVGTQDFRGGTHTGKRDNSGDFGIGGGLISRVISEALGVSRSNLREAYRKLGDMGDAAAFVSSGSDSGSKNRKKSKRQKLLTSFFKKSSSEQEQKPMTIREVYENLRNVATMRGQNSERTKIDLLVRMLRRCNRSRSGQIRFLVRLLLAANRCGASTTTFLCALSRASHIIELQESTKIDSGFLKECDNRVKKTLAIHPSLLNIASALVNGGTKAMMNLAVLKVETPVCPMLASPAHSMKEVIEWMSCDDDDDDGDDDDDDDVKKRDDEIANTFRDNHDMKFTLEYKYDGARTQIHCVRNDNTWNIRIYSRHLSEVTSKYPEAVKNIKLSLSRCKSSHLILDGEVVAVSRKSKEVKILPFQTLTTTSNNAHLCVYLFDCIFANGSSLLNNSLRSRRQALRSSIEANPGFVDFVSHIDLRCVADEDFVSKILDKSVHAGCEGLMAKSLSSPYEAGRRGGDFWKKIKADYVGKGVCDSLDVIPIGAWFGNGRKAGWLSPVLVAVYDEETEMYQSIGRIMSGLSDEFYKKFTQDFQGLGSNKKPFNVQTNERCSMWFAPPESSAEVISTGVWEVRGADLTLSKVHMAGDRGLGLRFPRFVRDRPDIKTRSGLTTSSEIDVMFSKQTKSSS